MFTRLTTGLVLLALCTSASAAQSEARNAERMRYQTCIAMSGDDPAEALEEAQIWRIEGGGWPAEVCEAHAYIALGDFDVAAGILEELASERRAGMVDAERVDFLTLAGETRARNGNADAAFDNYAAALALDPFSILTLSGRGRLYLAEENWGGLARDAQSLVDLVPESAEGWYLRAAFHLNTGDLDDAASDIEAARERAPERIEVLVLRGQINEARRLAASGG